MLSHDVIKVDSPEVFDVDDAVLIVGIIVEPCLKLAALLAPQDHVTLSPLKFEWFLVLVLPPVALFKVESVNDLQSELFFSGVDVLLC